MAESFANPLEALELGFHGSRSGSRFSLFQKKKRKTQIPVNFLVCALEDSKRINT